MILLLSGSVTVTVPELGEWPDAWIECETERLPVEVVATYPRRADERPRDGARTAQALAAAEREASRRMREEGAEVLLVGQVDGQAFVCDPGGRLPLPQHPGDPVGWVLTAIRQKQAKAYGDCARTVLVVELREWLWFEACEAADVARRLQESGCTFREVWVYAEAGGVRPVWPTG